MRIKLIMPRPNHNKTRVHLTINKDVLDVSRQYIPNLSQFLEEKLIEFLNQLENAGGGIRTHAVHKHHRLSRPALWST